MVEELDDILSASERFYGDAHTQMKVSDVLYNQNFAMGIDRPEDSGVHKSSKATQIVDNIRDRIRVDDPVVVYREKRSKHKDQAD